MFLSTHGTRRINDIVLLESDVALLLRIYTYGYLAGCLWVLVGMRVWCSVFQCYLLHARVSVMIPSFSAMLIFSVHYFSVLYCDSIILRFAGIFSIFFSMFSITSCSQLFHYPLFHFCYQLFLVYCRLTACFGFVLSRLAELVSISFTPQSASCQLPQVSFLFLTVDQL